MSVGIAENCIGLAENEIYESVVPQETRDLVNSYIEQIQNGEIQVKSAFDMSNEELLAFVDAAK